MSWWTYDTTYDVITACYYLSAFLFILALGGLSH